MHIVFGGSEGKSVRVSRYIPSAGPWALESAVNACEIKGVCSAGCPCVCTPTVRPVLGALTHVVPCERESGFSLYVMLKVRATVAGRASRFRTLSGNRCLTVFENRRSALSRDSGDTVRWVGWFVVVVIIYLFLK